MPEEFAALRRAHLRKTERHPSLQKRQWAHAVECLTQLAERAGYSFAMIAGDDPRFQADEAHPAMIAGLINPSRRCNPPPCPARADRQRRQTRVLPLSQIFWPRSATKHAFRRKLRGQWLFQLALCNKIGSIVDASSSPRRPDKSGFVCCQMTTLAVKGLLTLIFFSAFQNHDTLLLKRHGAVRRARTVLGDAVLGRASETASARVSRQAHALSSYLRDLGERYYPPSAHKSLRSFTSGEVAQIVGVSDGYLRQLSIDGLGPAPETGNGGRRSYKLRQINDLRSYLAIARPREADAFLHRRKPGDPLQVVTVANFKGGSAKTTTALYLIQALALQGFRVLAIDLDPQASLSAMFGYQPEFDIPENATLYGAIRYDDQRRPMREVIRETYFDGVGLVPGNLELMEFEHHTPRAMIERHARGHEIFFRRVAAAIGEVEDDYDVAVIDCPPQLGYLTMGALNAATSMLVTVHPQMVDIASMNQFLLMTSDLMQVIEEAGGQLSYDFLRYVVTRHDPRDVPELEIVGLLRNLFGDDVLKATAWKSTAIANAGLTKQSLYELPRGAFGRNVYDRALEAMNAVNAEVIDLIKGVWGR